MTLVWGVVLLSVRLNRHRVIISRSLETDRKFTKVCSTKRKVKIVRVSSGIAMDLFV